MITTNTSQDYDYGMPVHPVCDLFPLMDGEGIFNLQCDIEQNGLLNPIVVHEGQIVDGRNRLLACRQAKVDPVFVEWRKIYEGDRSIARWIWSMNAERRHLTVDQYVAAEVAITDWEKRQEEARQRMSEGGRAAGRSRPKAERAEIDRSQPITASAKRTPQLRTQIAQKLGVSERKVQQAINVQRAAPQLIRDVAKGKTSLSKVTKAAKTKPVKICAPKFDLDRSISKVMRVVDACLDGTTDQQRDSLISQLIITLEQIK